MDKSLIPKGLYCYSYGVKTCPYFTFRQFNEAIVPWCDFLNKGGIPNVGDVEYEKILNYYNGDINKMQEELPLDLLFDMVKECGENESL